jgi:hypothetical protein
VPDHGDDSYLEFRATAVDSNGYSTTASFNLPMDEHSVFVDATVPGVQFAVNGGGGPAPLSRGGYRLRGRRLRFDGVLYRFWHGQHLHQPTRR